MRGRYGHLGFVTALTAVPDRWLFGGSNGWADLPRLPHVVIFYSRCALCNNHRLWTETALMTVSAALDFGGIGDGCGNSDPGGGVGCVRFQFISSLFGGERWYVLRHIWQWHRLRRISEELVASATVATVSAAQFRRWYLKCW